MLNVLVVDDDELLLQAMRLTLESANTRIHAFSDPLSALASVSERHYDVVITDQRMPGIEGLDLLEQIRIMSPATRRVLVSAYREFDDVTKAFNSGILHRFLIKPWHESALRSVFQSCLAESPALPPVAEPRRKATATAMRMPSGARDFHGMLSRDDAMLRMFAFVETTARTGGPFHIRGETGTGKELVAKAIHLEHRGKDKPFVAVNCANLSETMLESQLFGHRKGAFTGAVTDQVGYLEAADGGTLFLDEITELPLALQAKLLRVLQEHEYVRLGDTTPRSIDVSIVSAGQVSLDDAVKSGRFRADLKYRLDVLPVRIPPLRERGDDVLLLFDYFLQQKWQRQQGKGEISCSPETCRILRQYRWPGNVRELINITTYVCAMLSSAGGEVTPKLLPEALLPPSEMDFPARKCQPPATVDRHAVLAALSANGNNKSAAARALSVSRMTVWRHLQPN